MGHHLSGTLAYADDLNMLSPSRSGLAISSSAVHLEHIITSVDISKIVKSAINNCSVILPCLCQTSVHFLSPIFNI